MLIAEYLVAEKLSIKIREVYNVTDNIYSLYLVYYVLFVYNVRIMPKIFNQE